jgi:hypothetical protein
MALGTDFGGFIATTNVWDVGSLQETDVNSVEFKELLVRLYQNVNNIAILLNLKHTGYYPLSQEFVDGKLFFPNPNNPSQQFRQEFRMTINFGQLPNTGAKSVPHGIPITSGVTFTQFYATASDTTNKQYIPIPYTEASGLNISLSADATNVTIETVSDRSNFNVCYVVCSYLKW